MHSTAISLTLPALTTVQRQQLLEDSHVCRLYELFATIPDPRRKEGQRYELPYLLAWLVAALRGPCNSTLAVGQWCREHRSLEDTSRAARGDFSVPAIPSIGASCLA
jgi:hypothetical protein